MMEIFCSFPDIDGLVPLCTGEVVTLVSNTYLVLLTIVVILLSRTFKVFKNQRWSCHSLIWILIAVNSLCTIVSSTTWLIIAHSEAIVIYQVIHFLSFICLPLCCDHFEQKFDPRWSIALTLYCLSNGISKMLTVTAFSKNFVTWSSVEEVDVRFLCACVQSVVLLLLSFITFYNCWRYLHKQHTALPLEEEPPHKAIRTLSHSLYLWCWEVLVKARSKTLQLADCIIFRPSNCEFRNTASSLLLLIVKEHCRLFLYSGVMMVVVLVLEFVPVLITYCLLSNLTTDTTHTTTKGLFTLGDIPHNTYCLIMLMFISETVRVLLQQAHNYLMGEIAAKSHRAIQSLLYGKVLRMAQWEIRERMTDLMTIQVDHVTTGIQMLHSLWKIPLQFTLSLIFLEILIGLSIFLPIGVLILLLLLNSWLLFHRSHLESELQTRKKDWYLAVQEYIEHIWILKIRNIHNIFIKKIETSKVPERGVTCLFTFIQALKQVTPTLLVLLLFVMFHVVKGERVLAVHAAVGAILLLSMLRLLLSSSQSACKQVLLMAEALADIANTLTKDETEPSCNIEEIAGSSATPPDDVIAVIRNGTFTWGSQRMGQKVLTDVNIRIPRGKLTLILGQTGSGKTSLLSALLGETHCVVGEVAWAGGSAAAVAAQAPLLLAGSVKDNVLFGSEYEPERYLKIVTLCNLKEHTLNISETHVHSYHPISLARALYSRAPVLVLDEPLKGLEASTRQQFFFESIVVFAEEEGRTIVMTTDNPDLVEHAQQVILLHNGSVEYCGTPDHLSHDNTVYLDLQATHNDSLPPPTPARSVAEHARVVELEENVNVKQISSNTYKEWIQSSDTVKLTLLLLSLFCMTFLNAIMYWLLLRWVDSGTTHDTRQSDNVQLQQSYLARRYNETVELQNEGILQFTVAGGVLLLVEMIGVLLVNVTVSSACASQLRDMLQSLSHMTLHHYNKHSLHHLLGRFTVDLELIGRPLMDCLTTVIFLSLQLLAALIVQVITSPGSLVILIPGLILIIWLYLLYKPGCRVVRILHADFKQNIYRHFNETISCVTLIRGYGYEERYKEMLEVQTHRLYNINLVWSGLQRWLSLYQDLTLNLLLSGCFVATTLVADQTRPELLALALLLLLLSASSTRLLWNLLDSCDVILASVESCVKLAYHAPREPDNPRLVPGEGWPPPEPTITVQDVFASMSEDEEPQLKNITLVIEPGTKLGVGSTPNGGKHFIVPLIFRSLYCHTGEMRICEWDVQNLDLSDLRKSIGFVPMDPPFFKGTIRYNLDPENEFEDSVLWDALKAASLDSYIGNLEEKLMFTDVYNFDRGIRRILYLAIMMLKKFKIIVIEEPKNVANRKLQHHFDRILNEELSSTTRILITQRNETLLSCSQLLLLDQGRVSWYGTRESVEDGSCPHQGTLKRQSRLVSDS